MRSNGARKVHGHQGLQFYVKHFHAIST